MRKIILSVFLLFSLLSFSSCETAAMLLVDTVLGREKCATTGCNRDRSSGSNYCMMHSHSGGYEIPPDLGKNVNQSISKQMEEYKETEKRMKTKSSD